MNEGLFFFHILIVVAVTFLALWRGKDALLIWACFQGICANLFVSKQMELFGLHVTCSDVYAVGAILSLNFLQEFCGKAAAATAISLTFYMMALFALLTKIHLLYIPSLFDTTHTSFENILDPMPHLLIASLVVFFIVQQIDFKVFGYLRQRFWAWPLALRNLLSLLLSQALDTALFTWFALSGMVESIWDVMLMSFLVKAVVIASMSVCVASARWILPSLKTARP